MVADKNDVRELCCLGAGVPGLDGTIDRGGDLVLCDEVAIGELDLACHTTFDRLPTPPSGINAGCGGGNDRRWATIRIPKRIGIHSTVCETKRGSKRQSKTTEVDCGVRWRIEATGELGQRLLLFFGVVRVLGVIMAEGYGASKRGGLLETDCVGTLCKGVSSVV